MESSRERPCEGLVCPLRPYFWTFEQSCPQRKCKNAQPHADRQCCSDLPSSDKTEKALFTAPLPLNCLLDVDLILAICTDLTDPGKNITHEGRLLVDFLALGEFIRVSADLMSITFSLGFCFPVAM